MAVGWRMEECVRLLCDFTGAGEDEEVGLDVINSLYKSVFLVAPSVEDTERAIAQVRGHCAASCSTRAVLQVLLLMDRQRENREQLYWELQLLKAGAAGYFLQHSPGFSRVHLCSTQQDPDELSILCLQKRSRTLSSRLLLDGICSILPLLRPHQHQVSIYPDRMSPTTADLLRMLDHKYHVIRERVLKEMLQEEYGLDWWNSVSQWDQMERLCELETSVGLAYEQKDWLLLCGLPGALRCYRSRDSCDGAGSREQAWSAVVFLSELESHHREEREALNALIHRSGQDVLNVSYLAMCLAVRRSERETCADVALLVTRQHWERWPSVGSSVSRELARLRLQDRHVPSAEKPQHSWKMENCTQQAVLQLLVQRQEQERMQLLDTLNLSCGDVHDSRAVGAVTLQQDPERATRLLTRLTQAQEDEAWTLLHTLPHLDSEALYDVIQKYQHELNTHTFKILCEILPSQTQEGSSRSLRDQEIPEEDHEGSSDEEKRCTGCGMAIDPDDTPYLEIVSEKGWMAKEDPMESRAGSQDRVEDSVEKQSSLIPLAWSSAVQALTLQEPALKFEDKCPEPMNEHCISRSECENDTPASSCEDNTCESAREGETKKSACENKTCESARGVDTSMSAHENMSCESARESSACESACERDTCESAQEEKTGMSAHKGGTFDSAGQSDTCESAREGDTCESAREGDTCESAREGDTCESAREGDTCESAREGDTGESTWEVDTCESGRIGDTCESSREVDTCESAREGGSYESAPNDNYYQSALEGNTFESGSNSNICESKTAREVKNSETGGEQETGGSAREDTSGCARDSDHYECACAGDSRGSEKECLQLQREVTMRGLVDIRRRTERRWQRDRDRQRLRVQERLAIVQCRKSDEDLLSTTQRDTFRHLTTTLQREDEQQQKSLVREKLEQMRRERSCLLQTRRERNTAGFKELLAPKEQRLTETEEA